MHGMQEVGGSIPPGSTSLRSLRELRLGKPQCGLSWRSERRLPRRSPQGEGGLANPIAAKTPLGEPIVRSALRCSLLGKLGGRAMKYVYILESLDSQHFYVGITDDLRARLAKHNAGAVPHTSKYGPWRMKDLCRVRR